MACSQRAKATRRAGPGAHQSGARASSNKSGLTNWRPQARVSQLNGAEEACDLEPNNNNALAAIFERRQAGQYLSLFPGRSRWNGARSS